MPTIPTLFLVGAVALWLVLGAISAGHAIMFKRDPRSAAIWLFISFFLPILGPWLYWTLGINRVVRRAVKHLGRRERAFDPVDRLESTPGDDALRDAVGALGNLRAIADRVARLPLLPGNSVVPLHNGEEAYPRMLRAIESAERSVTLASYIFDWDDVGRDFTQALVHAARRGVRVHALLDGVGALGSFSRVGRRLLRSGAEVAAFFPLRLPFGRVRMNLRNHRKFLIVDGRTGFTGGMNISQRHLVERDAPSRVEDLHFEIRGPVVMEMQHAFLEDWTLATGVSLHGDAYFPDLSAAGPALCRGISSGPDENFEMIHWILQAAFASAERSVRITTPYFVPTSTLIAAMATAALRGVDVALLLPSEVDRPYMRWAADAYLWELLEHGVRVYRRPPPFVHTKLLLVDERWILFGSANLDRRSFRLNFEFNLEAYDAELARRLSNWLDELIAQAQPVTLEQMDSRPSWRRLRDGIVKMFSPYL